MQASTRVRIALDRWRQELLDLTKRNRLLYFSPQRGVLRLTYPWPATLFHCLVAEGRTLTFYRGEGVAEAGAEATVDVQLALFSEGNTAREPPTIGVSGRYGGSGTGEAVNRKTQGVLRSPATGKPRGTSASDDMPSTPTPPRPPREHELVAEGDEKTVVATLYRLRQRARSALREQGINVLYVAFGTLEWSVPATPNERILSPLLLVPVLLDRESAAQPYQLMPLDDDPILNPALKFRLQQPDIKLDLTLPNIEAGDLTLDAALDHLRRIVARQPSWEIRTDVYLGLFSFAKQVMYDDLELNRDRFEGHPIIRLLAGEEAGLPPVLGDLPRVEDLDDRTTPAETFQVLDADASQQEVIAAVKAGANLVVLGPPGTGKSQTIANIIAETLAQRNERQDRQKTVLFVSEKMAALEVVARNLKKAGLEEFCLVAHSQDIKRETIVRELARALHGTPTPSVSPLADLSRLSRTRARLNAYARALHDADNAWGRSAFQVHGDLARLADAPIIPFPFQDIAALTPERLAGREEVVRRLAQVGAVLLGVDQHPWRGCTLETFSPQVQVTLGDQLRRLAAAAESAIGAQTTLRSALGLPADTSLAGAEWLCLLLDIMDTWMTVPGRWLRLPSLSPLIVTAEEERRRMETYQRRRTALLGRYTPDLFQLDLSIVLAGLVEGGGHHAAWVRGDGPPADRALAQQPTLDAVTARAGNALDALRRRVQEVASRVGLPVPVSLADARRLLELVSLVLTDPRPQPDWFTPGRFLEVEYLAGEAARQQETVASGRAAVLGRFHEDLFTVATPELLQRFEEAYGSWLRHLKPAWYRDSGRMRRLLREPRSLSWEEARDALRLARQVTRTQAWLDEHQAALVAGLGSHFQGPRTDWAAVDQALTTVRTLRGLLGDQPPPAPLLDILLGSQGGPHALRSAVASLDMAIRGVEEAWHALIAVLVPYEGAGGLEWADLPLAELAAWVQSWRAGVQPLWSAGRAVAVCRTGGLATVAQMVADVREALEVRATEEAVDAAAAGLDAAFGPFFAGLETQWDAVLGSLAWADRLVQHCGGPLPDAFMQRVTVGPPPALPERATLTSGTQEVAGLLADLRPLFGPGALLITGVPPKQAALTDLAAWAREKAAALPRLEEWTDLNRALRRAREDGLTAFVEGVQRERPEPDTWLAASQRQIATLWLDWRYREAPALAQFRTTEHETVINDFRRLDRGQCVVAAQRIAERLFRQRPQAHANLPRTSEVAILQREANRRRFHPLRRLFREIPHVLPVLKPCMLMSPLSVAEFLGESAITFDLVVFDEASQILPADAIGALGRGTQVVVVGDQQQLPPTHFFAAEAQIGDEETEEDFDLAESVLEACIAAGLPQRPLLWHYRSRCEHLIAFSSTYFYSRENERWPYDRLISFPSPAEDTPCVQFIHVPNGVYERGGSRVNREEARRVADLVMTEALAASGASLGVITFSEAQMLAVQAELDARKREHPELEAALREEGPEGFFVKNLENVQGDERDIIILSVGYGPDEAGRITINFGPLNKKGGERRLNVAVTRARHRMQVIASFLPQAIDLTRTEARGVHLLRRYLEFAQQGPSALLGTVTRTGETFESPFEESVATELRGLGLEVVPQVGVGPYRIDLGIRDPQADRYLLGIECDGAKYHRAKTARDRDRLRQEVLERMGWAGRIHRIWSTDWIKDPEREVARVLAALEDAAIPAAPASVEAATPPAPDDTAFASPQEPGTGTVPPPPEPGPRPSIARPYQVTNFGQRGTIEDFRTTGVDTFAYMVRDCVQLEGPVHEELVYRRIAESYQISRVRTQIRSTMQDAISHAVRAHGVLRRGPFLWPRDLEVAPVRGATPDGRRNIQHIPPEEIAACITAFLELVFSINREHLISGVAREFGYKRTGSDVAAAIDGLLDSLIAGGGIVEIGGQVRLWRG